MNQMGDLLFTLPALYNLRARFQEAHIASVARLNCKEVLTLSGLVDEIIERPRGFKPNAVKILRRGNFDLAVIFSTSFGMWTHALLSGAKYRVGFTHSMPGLFFHQRIPWSPPPSTQNNLNLVEAIGCPIVKTDYVGLIKPGQAEQDEARQALRSAGIDDNEDFIVLSPGTSNRGEVKRWSDEKFAEVADRLADDFGIKSAIVGLDGGDGICNLSKNVVDLTGQTPLPVLAGVLKTARAFVGVDSGVMHLAAAVGIPVVGLFGPSDPKITAPQGEGHVVITAGVDCAPCLKSECSDPKCMSSIEVDQVIPAIHSCLEWKNRDRQK